ncbi:MAG TPA: TetR/AcrR family transcriptional regulator [Thermoleophilaceae bacterium]
MEEHGYEAMRVADVLKLSGVSRTTFYEYFANKEECFLSVLDEIQEGALEQLRATIKQTAGSWEDRLHAMFERLVAIVVDQPAAAHMCFVEVFAAGPEAAERHTQALTKLQRLVAKQLGESPDRSDLPPAVVRGLIGGARKVIASRLLRHEEQQLREDLPQLWAWALAYTSPPTPLKRRRLSGPAESPVRFEVNDRLDRVLASIATVAEREGYAKLTVSDIVAEAATSRSVFYEHFSNKKEAFLAAYEAGLDQTFEAVLEQYRDAPDWESGVHAGLNALLSYLAVEHGWATLGLVEIFSAGSDALERVDGAIQAFEVLLGPGYNSSPDASPIYAEAIGGAVYALVQDEVRTRGPEKLPELLPFVSFLGLAPFIGTDKAQSVANRRVALAPER